MTDFRTRIIILDEKIEAARNEQQRLCNMGLVFAVSLAAVCIVAAHVLVAVPHSVEQVKLMQEQTEW